MLNSIQTQPTDVWPFVDLEKLPSNARSRGDEDAPYGWSMYEMMFGDVGSVHFMMDESGKIRWQFDCY